MNIKNKFKRIAWALLMLSAIGGALYVALVFQKDMDEIKYLPPESILKRQIRSDIETNINNALLNIIDRSDFELAVHINLNQDERTEELIKYEPKEISTSKQTKSLTPIPKINALPGLIDNPFHNESLPGFPSYFDQYDIEKDDFLTRAMFAKILSVAYQLPQDAALLSESQEIIDNSETEFNDSVSLVVNKDILKLYQSGEFRPNDFLSKASLITALVRINYPTSNYYSSDVISDLPFNDIPKTHWAYNEIKIALENKLINEDIYFNPNKKVTVEEALQTIENTPLRANTFNYYKFPKKQHDDIFKTENKQEITESNVYYNQEKTMFKSPSTKIKNISIRLIINEIILRDAITLERIESIVRSVVEINNERNDTFVISSYPFTNLPMIVRIYKWQHWQKIYFMIIVSILGYFSSVFYEKYKHHKINQNKLLLLKKQKEEKLAKIHQEEEEKSYARIKRDIVDEAVKDTAGFTLKLEKWLELLQLNQQYKDKPQAAYEKIVILILFVDFERPGLSTEIIKLFHSEHIKDTITSIETISKVETDKAKSNIIEFHENFMSSKTLVGGKTASNYIIDSAFSEKEKRNIFNINKEEPFTFVEHIPTSKIKEFIVSENEVVAAFLLNKCSEHRLLEITEVLPSASLKSIAKHLVSVRNNPCEIMDKFEEKIKDKLFIGESSESSKNKIQLQKASSVFETLPKDVRMSIFDNLQENDPDTLVQIKAEMFMFEDIEMLTDVEMQTLIFEIKDMEMLAMALNKSPKEFVDRFKQNFSERFATQFDNAVQRLEDIQDEQIDKAQYDIVRALRKLEKNERIPNLKELKRSTQ
jgi:flagellar motor switch protein FliG